MQLHGIIPPVVTPLTPGFQVDEPALRRVLRHLLAGGVHGLFLLGSSSEVIFMDAPQRREVLRIAVDEVAGRVPLLAGVIDPTTDRCIAHARDAQAAGVDGLVVTAPFYTRTSQAEIVEHFRAIRQAVPLPILAYDIPVCVHTKLERATLRQMRAEGLIVDVDHPERGRYSTVGCPFTLSDSPVEIKRSPLLGEHTAEILEELLELPGDELERLTAVGAV